MKEYASKFLGEPIPISAQLFKEKFGSAGYIYHNIKEELKNLLIEVKDENSVSIEIDNWKRMIEALYGYKPPLSLFIDHTYLSILAKIIIYLGFNDNDFDKDRTNDIINGNYFVNKGIKNFLEEDFSLWLLNPKIKDKTTAVIWTLIEQLINYEFSKIDEDIFKGIYEEIIESKERHKTGEYYTPEWLVRLILERTFALWEEQKVEVIPRILDPACGSGTFLFHIIKILGDKGAEAKDIIENVAGIDINPIATIIAKANYLIALSDVIKNLKDINLPVYTRDCLKSPDLLDYREIKEYDMIVGNPPWVVMRSIKSKEYQNFLKREVLNYHLLESKDVHLFTQLELATLFFCKCADLYLRKKGIIAFIMPRSVLAGTIHHINFRKFINPPIKLIEIIDLEKINPLFNMPSCILFGFKNSMTEYPILTKRYIGELSDRNVSFSEAKKQLSVEIYKYIPPNLSMQSNYYYDKFKVGASIFPRSFYFIDVISYIDSMLMVETPHEIYQLVKNPWKFELKGNIEDIFLYATLLAWEMIPFGYSKIRLVILPIKEYFNKYKLLNIEEMYKNNSIGIAKWFERAQEIWCERRTRKSEKRFPSLLDRLNYHNLLTIQNPNMRYVVLYNATGTNLVSCVIDKKSLSYFLNGEEEIRPQGFIVDVKTWFMETENEMEAYYLSAIFNSEILNRKMKPLQPRGLFGARAIHRRPLLFPIPKFSDDNYLHIKLANIGRECHEKIAATKFAQKKNIRAVARKSLKKELMEINQIVSELLNINDIEEG